MPTSDYIFSTLTSGLLHIVGMLLCAWLTLSPSDPNETPPQLNTTSIQLLLTQAGDQGSDHATPNAQTEQSTSEPVAITAPLTPPTEITPLDLEPVNPPPEFDDPPPPRPLETALPGLLSPAPCPLSPDSTLAGEPPREPLETAVPGGTAPALETAVPGGTAEGNLGDSATGDEAQVDSPPAPFRYIKPTYPLKARLQGREGQVELDVHVAADGSVSSATIASSSGSPDLDQAALKATLKATFQPAQRNGTPVPALARVTILFQLRNR